MRNEPNPYAPPRDGSAPHAESRLRETFRLGLSIAASFSAAILLSCGALAFRFSTSTRVAFLLEVGPWYELRLLARVIGTATFVVWLWRATTNVDILNGRDPSRLRWKRFGWLAVRLFRPGFLVGEIARDSTKDGQASPVAVNFWSTWLGVGILADVFSNVAHRKPFTVRWEVVTLLAHEVPFAIAVAAWVVVVREIDRRQQASLT